MSNSLSLINELLIHIEKYESNVGNADIREFAIFLKDSVVSSDSINSEKRFNKNDFHNYVQYPEIEFSALLTGLYRFSKHYLKKAFTNSSIKTIDEFGFLATLLKEESLLKRELIYKHLLEISSGSEIIKRLVKLGLIYEYPDKNDKRAKRVALTPEGKREIFSAFDDMYKVSEIVIGNLTKTEIGEALLIFNKLNYYHHHIYDTDRKCDLKELHQKYVGTDNI